MDCGGLGTDIFEPVKASAGKISEYDAVIYGGRFFANSINGVKFIKRNLSRFNGENVVVFATGLARPGEETKDEGLNKNFTPGQRKQIRFFYFRGGFDFNSLGGFERFVIKMMKKATEKKELTPDEREMLDAFEDMVDYTSRDDISEMVSYVRQK